MAVAGVGLFQAFHTEPGTYYGVLTRTPVGTTIFGYLPVVPMTIISALLVIVASLVTPKPGADTIARYFKARA
jgi:hypothetical protein